MKSRDENGKVECQRDRKQDRGEIYWGDCSLLLYPLTVDQLSIAYAARQDV